MRRSPAGSASLALALMVLAIPCVAGADAASSSSSGSALARIYDLRIVGSGTTRWDTASVTMRWTQSVAGLRIRLRGTSPVKGQIAFDLGPIGGRRTGIARVEVLGNPQPLTPASDPDPCPDHAVYSVPIWASVGSLGLGGIGAISIGAPDGTPKCSGAGVVRGDGGTPDPPQRKGAPPICTGHSGLCWQVDSYSTQLNFPTFRKSSKHFKFPMDGIAAGRTTATTIVYEKRAEFSGDSDVKLSVRVTLTPHKG